MDRVAFTVVFLGFVVDFLLLNGASRLSGCPPEYFRVACASVVGAAYTGMCLAPTFFFLAEPWWRFTVLCVVSIIAFGFEVDTFRKGAAYILLSLALGGAASAVNGTGPAWTLAAAIGVCLLCLMLSHVGNRKYVPVSLNYCGRKISVLALRDTGNTLRDPITGKPVLIAGPEVAHSLLGIGADQLRRPVETVASGVIPGMRLVPYRSVGKPHGLLAALTLQNVQIGREKGSYLVAFAPDEIGENAVYKMLAGGSV